MLNTLLRKAKLAIKSRLEYKKELTDIQRKRLEVCKTCPFNSDNKTTKNFKENAYIYLNQFLNFILNAQTTEDAICIKCGCNLVHKSSQEDKNDWCDLGKWDNIK